MSKPGSRIQRLKEFTGLVDDSPRDYDGKEGKHRKTVTNKQYIFFIWISQPTNMLVHCKDFFFSKKSWFKWAPLS